MTSKKILVAAGWPYANTQLHLGHVAGLLGADIIARYHRLAGNEVLFVSGSDCYGTPIAIEADKAGAHPSEIIAKHHKKIKHSLVDRLNFSYDIYTTTTTETHHTVVQEIFLKLYHDKIIYAKTEDYPYCNSCNRFLADRYIEGTCSICKFENARGGECDKCGSCLEPNQLLNPKCKTCGTVPQYRPSEHFYLRLSIFQERLREWIEKSSGWRINAKQLAMSLTKQDLPDRAITRDIEWGVPIPLPGYEKKRIYVWFEAVCGYLSASKEYSKLKGDNDYWKKFWTDEAAIHYYVHGKDNIFFHTIIWPSILLGVGGLHLPDRIISSEFLTLEKHKFSKSRGVGVMLNDFLDDFDVDTLRYYLVTNGPETSDADFTWESYYTKTNSELIGTLANYVHRVLSFVKVHFRAGVEMPSNPSASQAELLNMAKQKFVSVSEAIEQGQFRNGLRQVLDLATLGNVYINNAAPWFSIKKDPVVAAADLAVAGHAIRCLAVLLNPFLPSTSDRINRSLGADIVKEWKYPDEQGTIVHELAPLYTKIELRITN